MRVTPINILIFWKRLMFPPLYTNYSNAGRKGDLPWEPWLHATVWLAVIATWLFGETHVSPPGDAPDWVWLLFGLVFPPVGFFSVWMIQFGPGSIRYVGMWSRATADFGLAVAILSYLLNKLLSGTAGESVMGESVLLAGAWYMVVLVKRDVEFIILTERLADAIYRTQVDDAG